ncbi:hypothetical protein [Roseomonas xinghualingensis]|uniref:hypothetical protein n=1 Tax=Roseomonas xinghualingensis TaxID=2986475 RepID=UPI0021F1D9F1|nr:hypothetical protein [Roseomonas sp. SXEYE001]
MMHARVARVRAPVLISGTLHLTAEQWRWLRQEAAARAAGFRLEEAMHAYHGRPGAARQSRLDVEMAEAVLEQVQGVGNV